MFAFRTVGILRHTDKSVFLQGTKHNGDAFVAGVKTGISQRVDDLPGCCAVDVLFKLVQDAVWDGSGGQSGF